MLTVPNLLSGATPVYDPQAIPDATDWAIAAAGDSLYGVVFNDSHRPPPTVTPCTATTTMTTTTSLATLTGTQSVGVGSTASLPASGYISAPSSGGGTAYIGYNGVSGGNTLLNCFWISGGSGNITATTTLTSICAVTVSAGWIAAPNAGLGMVQTQLTATAVSIVNSTGTAWQSLPSSSGDRKDMVVCTSAGVISILQGTPVAQAGSTRSNQSYTNPPPVKPAWASGTPIALAELMVPGVGATGANAIVAGNITDKTVGVPYPGLQYANGFLGADMALTASTLTTIFTVSLTPGSWMLQGAVTFYNGSGAARNVGLQVVAGTATTYLGMFGQTACEVSVGQQQSGILPFNAQFLVTASGTMLVQIKANGVTVSAKELTQTDSFGGGTYGGASGYVATRLG